MDYVTEYRGFKIGDEVEYTGDNFKMHVQGVIVGFQEGWTVDVLINVKCTSDNRVYNLFPSNVRHTVDQEPNPSIISTINGLDILEDLITEWSMDNKIDVFEDFAKAMYVIDRMRKGGM